MDTFVHKLQHNVRVGWLAMLELPWQHSGPEEDRREHWLAWLVGWAWSLAGLVLGALIAPSVVKLTGFAGVPYQDSLVIGIAVLAGFVVQLLGTVLASLWNTAVPNYSSDWTLTQVVFLLSTQFVVVLLPLAGVGYGIYRYLTWVGAGERTITIAFVGGLLIKTFVIPAITGALQSKAFKLFKDWLRGKNTKKTV